MVTNLDTTYANYLRLCGMLLIPVEEQLTSTAWAWSNAEQRRLDIESLMNRAVVRDQPEQGQYGGEAAW